MDSMNIFLSFVVLQGLSILIALVVGYWMGIKRYKKELPSLILHDKSLREVRKTIEYQILNSQIREDIYCGKPTNKEKHLLKVLYEAR